MVRFVMLGRCSGYHWIFLWNERIIMAKRKSRIKRAVEAAFHVPSLSKAGSSLNLEIYADREKIGQIVLGRGSLYWYAEKPTKKENGSPGPASLK